MSLRIYMAGLFSGGRIQGRSTNMVASSMSNYPWKLESYHYIGRSNSILNYIREKKMSIFLDSGAFSMFTQGIEVDLGAYSQFIKDNQDILHIASNLDIIGRNMEQASYDNQKSLEKMGVKIQPVHHARDKDEWLQRYLDEGYEYIFLGGMVPENTTYLHDWLDHVWERYLTNPDGTAKIKVHGFGMTSQEIMFRYPWASVDSTSWVMASRYGHIYLDIREGSTFMIDFSNQSSMQYRDNSWHYSTLKPVEKKRVLDRLMELEAVRIKYPETEAWLEEKTGIKQGYYPEALAKMYGWRDHFNINYFNRIQARGIDRFIRKQPGLFL